MAEVVRDVRRVCALTDNQLRCGWKGSWLPGEYPWNGPENHIECLVCNPNSTLQVIRAEKSGIRMNDIH